jgi:hypothetical protein
MLHFLKIKKESVQQEEGESESSLKLYISGDIVGFNLVEFCADQPLGALAAFPGCFEKAFQLSNFSHWLTARSIVPQSNQACRSATAICVN